MPITPGLFKQKGKVWSITPERFGQLPSKLFQPWAIRRIEIIGYSVTQDGMHWLIAEFDNGYVKIPFAKNRLWFDAFSSEVEFAFIRDLTQIYVIGFG